MDLGAVLAREVHVGEHVVLRGIHQLGELGHPGAELVGTAAPMDVGGVRIGFGESSPYPGGDQAALVFPAWAVALRMKCTRQGLRYAPQALPLLYHELGHDPTAAVAA